MELRKKPEPAPLEANPFLTDFCPVCGAPMAFPVVIVCKGCFIEIPRADRSALSRQFRASGENWKVYAGKARECIRNLKAARASKSA